MPDETWSTNDTWASGDVLNGAAGLNARFPTQL